MFGTRNRLRIGEIAGHEIAIDPVTTLIIAFLLLSGNDKQGGVAILVAIFLSVLVHELGHALAIRRLTGQHTLIIIGGFGGVTLSGGTPYSRKQLLISLAGPGAGFVLGAVGWLAALSFGGGFYGFWPWEFYWLGSVWLLCLNWIVYVSFLWGAVNLLPAYPLDGGQALRAFLIVRGVARRTAGRITRRLGMVIAGAAGVWALSEQRVLLVIICAWVFLTNFDESRREGY